MPRFSCIDVYLMRLEYFPCVFGFVDRGYLVLEILSYLRLLLVLELKLPLILVSGPGLCRNPLLMAIWLYSVAVTMATSLLERYARKRFVESIHQYVAL